MKSLEELKAIREKMKRQMDLRENDENSIRVVVGMATCGIAAGAKPVLAAFLDEIQKRDLHGVTVTQTGCIGVCRLEPVVEVFAPGEEKVTYVKVEPVAEVFVPGEEKVTYVRLRPEMVPSIVEQHLVNHNVVQDYTIGAAE